MDSTKSRALEEALRKDFVHDRLPLDIGAVASAKLARLATPRSNRNEKVPQYTADPSTIHIETPVFLARSALDILAGEDLKRLLQGLDLGLATRDALFVAHARVDAARLQLVVVGQRRVQLPLRTLEVFLVISNSASFRVLSFSLLSASAAIVALSTPPSDMNVLYSEAALSSSDVVSLSRRAKSEAITSSMPTTPPPSAPMPL